MRIRTLLAALATSVAGAAAAQGGAAPFTVGDLWKGSYRCAGVESPFTLQIEAVGTPRTPSTDPGHTTWTVRAEVQATPSSGAIRFGVSGLLRPGSGGQLALRPLPQFESMAGSFGLGGSLRHDGTLLSGTVLAPGCESYTLRRDPGASVAGTGPSPSPSVSSSPAAATPTRTPTALDMLPQGVTVSAQECQQGLSEVRQIAQAAMFSGARQAQVEESFQAVPPQWAQLGQRYPELVQWIREVTPNGCPPRATIRAWLRATGQPAQSIDAPGSVVASEAVLREAREKLRVARAEAQARDQAEEQRFRAQVTQQAQTEAGQVGQLDLEQLELGATRAAVLARLPPALCEVTEAWARCVRADPCTAQRTALREAERARVPALGTTWRPSDRAFVEQRVADAATRLRRCQMAYEASAAFRSTLSYGEQAVRHAELRFTGGVLTQVDFSGVSNDPLVRERLTRRLGPPSERFESTWLPVTRVEQRDHLLTPWDFRAPWEEVGQVVQRDELVQDMERVPVRILSWQGPRLFVEFDRGRFSLMLMSR